MKKIILSLLFMPVLSIAAGAGPKLDHVKTDVSDIATLQRGAKLYVNYCMGCHSLKFVSYGRLKKDLHLTKDQVFKHVVGTHGEKKRLSDYMLTSLSKEQATQMFNAVPPDLSTISRARGIDWLYTYMRSFYVATKEYPAPFGLNAFGMNNTVSKGISMPHAMLTLQGKQAAKFEKYTVTDAKGKKTDKYRFIKFVPLNEQGLSKEELAKKLLAYDNHVRDLVTFLEYVGDPGRVRSEKIGFWVILFMIIFTILAYLMKKEYWKDIH